MRKFLISALIAATVMPANQTSNYTPSSVSTSTTSISVGTML